MRGQHFLFSTLILSFCHLQWVHGHQACTKDCVKSKKANGPPKKMKNKSGMEGRIAGGQNVKGIDFPYSVHLEIYEYPAPESVCCYICGGTIVDSEWIITAAHCIDDIRKENVYVWAGFYSVEGPGRAKMFEQMSEVDDKHSHPDYTVIDCGNNKSYPLNDIAVIKLKTPLFPSDFVKSVLFDQEFHPDNRDLTGQQAWIFGFGQKVLDGPQSDLMQGAVVTIREDQICEDRAPIYTPGKHLCAGDNNVGARDGDSGGGLIIQNRTGHVVLVGVNSGFATYQHHALPASYERVGYYYDLFIKRYVDPSP